MRNKRKGKEIVQENEGGQSVATAKGVENISRGEARSSRRAPEASREVRMDKSSSLEAKKRKVEKEEQPDELHDVVLMAGVQHQGGVSTKQMPQKSQNAMDIPDLGKLVVLVCDTDRESRLKTVELLRQCGYKVLMSSRGSVAFEMLEREYEKGLSVDVILKSHDPPSSSAVVFLEHLRSSRDEYKDILVIVYSDREHQLDKQAMAACLSLGAVDLWVKPLRINEVGNIWTRVWQQKHKEAALLPRSADARNGSGGTSQPSTKGSGKTHDVSAASENDKVATNGMNIEQEQANHTHHKHHKRHKHHKHFHGEHGYVRGQTSHYPDLPRDATITSIGNGSSGKQSATIPAKKHHIGIRSSMKVESNPTIEDAEVADALTLMKSQRSTDMSGDDHHQQLQGTDQSKDKGVKHAIEMPTVPETFKTGDGSGGSTQFLAKLPFIPGVVNYGQYPFPWMDGNGRDQTEKTMNKQALDFQRAWLEWQQQYQQAIQMNYAMQGGRCMWPPMNMKPYAQSYNGWGQGSGIPPVFEKSTSSIGTQSKFASTVSRDELARLQAVKRYREKRTKRTSGASTKIRYKSRKILADARPRVRGQFVQVRKDNVDDRAGSSALNTNKDKAATDGASAMNADKLVPKDEQQHETSTRHVEANMELKEIHDHKDALGNDSAMDGAKSKGAETHDRPSDSGSNSPQSHRRG